METTHTPEIQVRPLPATETRGRRTVAYTELGRVALPYDYALSAIDNARAVVDAYISQHFFPVDGGTWVLAYTPTGWVAVWCPSAAKAGGV